MKNVFEKNNFWVVEWGGSKHFVIRVAVKHGGKLIWIEKHVLLKWVVQTSN